MGRDIPLGWTVKKVVELVSYHVSGPSPNCEERPVQDGEWGLLKTTAITWDGWDQNAHKTLPPEYWGQRDLEVHEDDVLVTKAGPRHRVGVVAHVDCTPPRLMVSGKMVLLRPDRSVVEPRILAGALSVESVQRHLDERTTGMAESQVNFSNLALLNTPLLLPSLSEQRRIAEILDTLGDQIKTIENLIAKTICQKSGLIEQLMSRDSTSSPHRNIGSVLARIDAGWSPLCNERHPARNEWGVLKVSAITSGRYRCEESKTLLPGMTPRPDIEVRNGDLLICRANGAQGLVGVAVLVDETPPRHMLSDKILRLVVDESQISAAYLNLFLASNYARGQVAAFLSGSSGQNNISQHLIKSMIVHVPSLQRQQQAVRVVAVVDGLLRSYENDLVKLGGLKQGLMDDLLTGRVRVREYENAL